MKKYKLFKNCIDLEIIIEAISYSEAVKIVYNMYNIMYWNDNNIILIETK